jgi:hypothetical protein
MGMGWAGEVDVHETRRWEKVLRSATGIEFVGEQDAVSYESSLGKTNRSCLSIAGADDKR